MNHIIIAGVPRSGKSTIAKRVADLLNINYMPFDSLVSTMGRLYPEHGITHYQDSKLVSKRIMPFMKELVKNFNYEQISYVIDIYQIYPNDLLNIIDMKEYIVLYIGYPRLESSKKLDIVRQYSEKHDWTKSISDEELLNIIHGYIEESKEMYLQCRENSIKYVDTGKDFEQGLEVALEYILKNCK